MVCAPEPLWLPPVAAQHWALHARLQQRCGTAAVQCCAAGDRRRGAIGAGSGLAVVRGCPSRPSASVFRVWYAGSGFYISHNASLL